MVRPIDKIEALQSEAESKACRAEIVERKYTGLNGITIVSEFAPGSEYGATFFTLTWKHARLSPAGSEKRHRLPPNDSQFASDGLKIECANERRIGAANRSSVDTS